MLDCGNSRTRESEKSRRRHNRIDNLCDLVDSLRYFRFGKRSSSSLGPLCQKDFEMPNGLNYDRRNSGSKYCDKPTGVVCNSYNKPSILKFDGGNSSSVYSSGPVFDCGSSGSNLPEVCE